MEFDYILTAIDPQTGETVEVEMEAPSQYRAKVIGKHHCERFDLEYVGVELVS